MNLHRAVPAALLIFCSSIGAAAAATAVHLAWDANQEQDLTGYIIQYGTSPGTHPASIDVGKVTSYQVDGLPEGQAHYFVAVAYDYSRNMSPKSNEIAAVPSAVPALQVSASASPGTVLAGGTIVYTFSFANFGSVAASGVMITAALPPRTTFLSTTGGGVLAGSSVYWSVGTLLTGGNSAVQLAVQVDLYLQYDSAIRNWNYSLSCR